MPKLLIIIASTRGDVRAGKPIGDWAAQAARAHGGFTVEVADLAEIDLPFIDEPMSPRMGNYAKEHTKQWSAVVDGADAILLVTPEYNYGPPPSLLNAIDFLYWEWAYKPVGFVSYGGVAAGLRSVQVIKQIITTVKVMPVPDGVAIPFVMKQLVAGEFAATELQEATLSQHLDEVLRWADALAPLRAQVPELKKIMPPGAPPMAPPPGVRV